MDIRRLLCVIITTVIYLSVNNLNYFVLASSHRNTNDDLTTAVTKTRYLRQVFETNRHEHLHTANMMYEPKELTQYNNRPVLIRNSASSTIEQRNGTDNRKPAFKGCSLYSPTVKEEQPSNVFVIKVEAEDPDESDTIEYSFVTAASERPKFRIDPKTGDIYTSHTFDRDEPIREKEVSFKQSHFCITIFLHWCKKSYILSYSHSPYIVSNYLVSNLVTMYHTNYKSKPILFIYK